jgi:hypothetical protein
MPPAAAIGGGALAGIGGGLIEANAARQAAGIQAGSADRANQFLGQMYGDAKGYQQPYLGAGTQALGQMQNPDFQRDFTMADYQADPGFEFRMNQGMQTLQRSAAAKGGLMGGQTMKALTDYSQGQASNEYQNAYNRFNSDRDRRYGRLGQIAGMGQNAASSLGSMAMGYGGAVGQNYMNAADAQAAARMATGHALGGTMGNLGGMGMQYGTMKQMGWKPGGMAGS